MCIIKVVARDSLLSQRQVEEVQRELYEHHPHVVFEVTLMKAIGDLQLDVSLMGQEKTNFFTKELDEYVLQGFADVGIHSAKDLPEPLPPGLKIYALTQGVDPSDSLVFSENCNLHNLPYNAKIGTSSQRRIESLRKLRADIIPVDIRGPIGQRLALLKQGVLDGVVIAEAALIRLGLTHLNRIKLVGEVSPWQGRLAIVGKEDNSLLKQLFKSLDQGD